MAFSFDYEYELYCREVSDKIDSIDNKTLKTMAVDHMNSLGYDKVFRRSDLTMKDCRCIIYQAVLFQGYQL